MSRQRHLVSRKYSEVESHLGAYIDESGLVLSGQDFGPGIALITAGSDYEYWITVPTQHLDRLHNCLQEKLGREPTVADDIGARNHEILELMRKAFQDGTFETDGAYRRWLNRVRIPNKFSSY